MADETQEAGGIHFPFPFTPYAIQKDFMAALYQVLEAGKIGIFESPTGTVSMTSGGPRRSGETLMTRGVGGRRAGRDIQQRRDICVHIYVSM